MNAWACTQMSTDQPDLRLGKEEETDSAAKPPDEKPPDDVDSHICDFLYPKA